MNVTLMNVSPESFSDIIGTRLFSLETVAQVTALSYKAHTGIEGVSAPFWATDIQDIIERGCITYSSEEIRDEKFLGARIRKLNDGVEVSLGTIGKEEAVLSIVFKHTVDEEGYQVLGEVLRFGNVELVHY